MAEHNVQGDLNVGRDFVAGDQVAGDKVVTVQNIRNIYQQADLLTPRMAPVPPSRLVGQDELLWAVMRDLHLDEEENERENPYMVVVKGMAGVGKTAVAATVANDDELEAILGDGALWAHLGPEADPMTWLASWGKQLGLDLNAYNSVEARSRAIQTSLFGKRLLIVLDDVWTAADARPLLVGGPNSRVIITTRDGRVADAFTSAFTSEHQVEPLSVDNSIHLLQTLAPDVVASESEGARKLARHLGGLPMSLMLAGQMLAREWRAGLGITAALEELTAGEARLNLSDASHDALPSLRAMLELSYRYLPDEHTRQAFRLMGVFGSRPKSFTWQAGAAVWGMESRPAQKVVVSLVNQQMMDPLGAGRYALHNAFADFALLLLREDREAEAAYNAHLDYYYDFVEQNGSDWRRVEPELDQIRTAFHTAARRKDLGRTGRFLQIMNPYFMRQGLWTDLNAWTAKMLTLAKADDNRPLLGQLYNNLGLIYYQQSDWRSALDYYRRSCTVLESINDHVGVAVTMSNMGSIYGEADLIDEALSHYEQAQELFEAEMQWGRLASVLNDIGGLYRRIKMWDVALSYHKLSQRLYKGLDNPSGLARTLNQIGAVYDVLDQWSEALTHYEEAYRLFIENGNLVGEGVSLYNLALIYEGQGQYDQAVEAMARVVEIDRQLNRPDLAADEELLARMEAKRKASA